MLIYSITFLLLSNAVSSISSQPINPSISEDLQNNTLKWDKSILYSRVAILILLYSALLCYLSLYLEPLDSGIAIYGGLFHLTSTSQIFQIFILLISAAILQLTAFYPRKVWVAKFSALRETMSKLLFSYSKQNYNSYSLASHTSYRRSASSCFARQIINQNGEQFKIKEYALIILFTVTGAIFLQSSSDLVSIFLSIELQSYGLYLLSTIYRNSEEATGGGLTYFLLGGLSSCFILLGISLLYANSGTTNLDGLYIMTSLSDLASFSSVLEGGNSLDNVSYCGFGCEAATSMAQGEYIDKSLIIFSVGFLFKISAAPFHFWSPDVYDGIPTIVTTFVAIIAKISILILLLEIVHYTSNSYFALQGHSPAFAATGGIDSSLNSKFTWSTSLLYSSLLSLIIGTVVGLTQFRIKRLFAYSTISHVGFILLALSINSVESIQAFIFYLMQYSISNLNAFIIIIAIGYSLYYYVNDNKEFKELKDKNNSPIQLISQMKGYFEINPYLALSLAITIFSFAGIPPLVGFFAKQMVLSAALDSGYLFLTLIAILTSVVGAVYYLGIIKQVFFDKSDYIINPVLLGELAAQKAMPYLGSGIKHLPNEVRLDHSTCRQSKGLIKFNIQNIVLSSYLTITISILTLIIILFIFTPKEWLNLANILALIIWNS